MQRRNRFQDRFYFRDGGQAEDLPQVEILEDLRTLGIGALRQHGELLPAVQEKCYATASEKKVMPDTDPGDFHHRVREGRLPVATFGFGLRSSSSGPISQPPSDVGAWARSPRFAIRTSRPFTIALEKCSAYSFQKPLQFVSSPHWFGPVPHKQLRTHSLRRRSQR